MKCSLVQILSLLNELITMKTDVCIYCGDENLMQEILSPEVIDLINAWRLMKVYLYTALIKTFKKIKLF